MMEIAETSSLNGDAIISPDCVEELKKPGRKKRSPLNSRFAEPCSSNSEFQATPHYDLDVEDASFVLRKLGESANFETSIFTWFHFRKRCLPSGGGCLPNSGSSDTVQGIAAGAFKICVIVCFENSKSIEFHFDCFFISV